ncbi:MAG TPA: hypothetical protein VNR51_04290, partial [Hyphomicrobium sp.]|nr:hypothetical protein [Hyphomicrobium sp.]
ILLDDALEVATNALLRRSDLAFVYGGYREVGPHREPIAEHSPDPARIGYEGLLRGNHIAMHGTVVYRSERLRDVGGFDTKLPCCEDYDVYLKIASRWPIEAYPYIAAEYRRHGGNMSANAGRMLRASLSVLRRHGAEAAARDLQVALADGERFWQDYYGDKLVSECWRLLREKPLGPQLRACLATGAAYDPIFWRRIAERVRNAAGRLSR